MIKTRYIVTLFAGIVFPFLLLAQQGQEERAFLYANKLYDDGLYEIAIEQYRQYLDTYPRGANRAEAALQIGKSQVHLHQFDDARRTFLEIDLDYPGTPQAQAALNHLAKSFEMQSNWERAAKAYQRLYLYYPDGKFAKSSLLNGAESALKSENTNLAISLLNTVVENYYDTEEAIGARLRLARVYQQTGKIQRAWSELDKALYSSPSERQRGEILLKRAWVAETMWGEARAAQIYEQIIEEFKRDTLAARASLERGRLALVQQQYETAQEFIENATGSEKAHIRGTALEYYGDLYWIQQQYGMAGEQYSQALEEITRSTQRVKVRIKYALALAKSDQQSRGYDELKQISRQLASIPVQFAQVYYDNFARFSIQIGQYRDALTALRQLESLSEQTDRASVMHRIADLAHYQMQDYDLALQTYQTISDSFPHYPEIDKVMYAYGKAATQAGEPERAAHVFRQLLNQYPYSFWRTDAKENLWYLSVRKHRDEGAGFDELATLFGELLLENNPAGLYFRLGKIYYHQQQNYRAAASQFETLLEKNLLPDKQDSVRYYLGNSYRILGRKAEFLGEMQQSESLYAKAAKQFEYLLNEPGETGIDLDSLRLRLADIYRQSDPEKAGEYLESISGQREDTILKIVQIYQQSGRDSLAFNILDGYLQGNLGSVKNKEIVGVAASLAEDLMLKTDAQQYYEWYAANFGMGPFAAQSWWALLRYAVADSEYTMAQDYARKIQHRAYYTPYYYMVREQLGELYMQTGDYLTAASWFEALARESSPEVKLFIGVQTSENTEAIYWTAFAYEKAGKTTGALKYFKKYIEEGTHQLHLAEAHEYLADRAVESGDYRKAREYYLQAIASIADTSYHQKIRLRKSAADMLFQLGQYEEAAEEYANLLDVATNELRNTIWAQLIIAEIRGDNLRRANRFTEEFTETIALEENAVPLLRFRFEKAKLLASDKKYQQSVPILRSILENNLPEDFAVEVRYELGRQLVITNNTEDAINLLTDLTVNHPENPIVAQAYITLGRLYYAQEQPANAIEAFRSALNYDTMDEYKRAAMGNLIKLYDERGLWDAAIAMGKRYVSEYPDANDAFSTRIQIGTFLMNMREYDRAIDHLNALMREADAASASEIQFWIGEAYFNQAKYTQAIIEYLKVPYLHPPTKLDWAASALWKAGNAYEKLRQPEKAITLYERIIREKGAASNFGRFARRRIDALEAEQSAAE